MNVYCVKNVTDEACQVVAEAGAVSSVMSVMSSYTNNAEVQQSCCWALASLSRSGIGLVMCTHQHSVDPVVYALIFKTLSR